MGFTSVLVFVLSAVGFGSGSSPSHLLSEVVLFPVQPYLLSSVNWRILHEQPHSIYNSHVFKKGNELQNQVHSTTATFVPQKSQFQSLINQDYNKFQQTDDGNTQQNYRPQFNRPHQSTYQTQNYDLKTPQNYPTTRPYQNHDNSQLSQGYQHSTTVRPYQHQYQQNNNIQPQNYPHQNIHSTTVRPYQQHQNNNNNIQSPQNYPHSTQNQYQNNNLQSSQNYPHSTQNQYQNNNNLQFPQNYQHSTTKRPYHQNQYQNDNNNIQSPQNYPHSTTTRPYNPLNSYQTPSKDQNYIVPTQNYPQHSNTRPYQFQSISQTQDENYAKPPESYQHHTNVYKPQHQSTTPYPTSYQNQINPKPQSQFIYNKTPPNVYQHQYLQYQNPVNHYQNSQFPYQYEPLVEVSPGSSNGLHSPGSLHRSSPHNQDVLKFAHEYEAPETSDRPHVHTGHTIHIEPSKHVDQSENHASYPLSAFADTPTRNRKISFANRQSAQQLREALIFTD